MSNRNRTKQEPQQYESGSVYNLTFDEVQGQLGNTGNPLHSMNLDELLKNVISAENGQLVHQNPSPSDHDSFLNLGNNISGGDVGTLSSGNNNKTINEVWRDIVNQEHVNVNGSLDNNNLQQSILGETTLEDFLARAGVINMGNNQESVNDAIGEPLMAMEPMVMASQPPEDWLPLQLQMQMPAMHIHQQHQHQQEKPHFGLCPDFGVVAKYENPVMEMGYSENSHLLAMSSVPMVAATMSTSSTCSYSKGGVGAAAGGRRQRHSDEMLEKTIERRQKRMAKNRESAARSRAKKQEHINKLQKDKFRLEKTNRWLKKLKEVDEQLFSASTLTTPKYQLRRTSSTTF